MVKLPIVGDTNNLSDKMYEGVKPLKPGQKAIFRWTVFDENVVTKEKFFGSIRTINLKDNIYDSGKSTFVEIGIPDLIEKGKVVKFKKKVFDGGGPGGLVQEHFELSGDDVDHVLLYTFLCLYNKNLSNKNRRTGIQHEIEQVDVLAESTQKASKRSLKRRALAAHEEMKNADILLFAASLNWNTKNVHPQILSDKVGDYAEKHPDKFLDSLGSKRTAVMSVIRLATDKGVIRFDRPAFRYIWGDSGNVIAKLVKEDGKDELALMADWVQQTKDGPNVFDAIKSEYQSVLMRESGYEDMQEEKEEKIKATAGTGKGNKKNDEKQAEETETPPGGDEIPAGGDDGGGGGDEFEL